MPEGSVDVNKHMQQTTAKNIGAIIGVLFIRLNIDVYETFFFCLFHVVINVIHDR